MDINFACVTFPAEKTELASLISHETSLFLLAPANNAAALQLLEGHSPPGLTSSYNQFLSKLSLEVNMPEADESEVENTALQYTAWGPHSLQTL